MRTAAAAFVAALALAGCGRDDEYEAAPPDVAERYHESGDTVCVVFDGAETGTGVLTAAAEEAADCERFAEG